MTNVKALEKAYKESGVTITFIAKYMGCTRNKVYSIMQGNECTVSDMIAFCQALKLTKEQRDEIFLTCSVN